MIPDAIMRQIIDLQREKDKTAGVYLDGVRIDSLPNIFDIFGTIVIVQGIEQWIGINGELLSKIDLCRTKD